MQVILHRKEQQVLDALLAENLLSQDIIDNGRQLISPGENLFEYFIRQDILGEEDLVRAVAQVSQAPYINLTEIESVNPKTLTAIPLNVAQVCQAVCVGVSGGQLVVGMSSSDNLEKVNYLTQAVKRPMLIHMASSSGVQRLLGSYEIEFEDITDTQQPVEATDSKPQAATDQPSSLLTRLTRGDGSATDVETIASESPATKALSAVLKYAIANNCSDIHIESFEDQLRIRVRLDGVLKELQSLDRSYEPGIMAKLKIESKLKVDEKRRPQDGEFSVAMSGKNIDLRVAITPTIFGEQAILRILDQSSLKIGLENLGYCGQSLKDIRAALKMSSGMILTSGPTGSGKTTTLYTLLQEVNSPKVKIITLEDPAEYKMDGVNQIQVNPDIDVTFAAGLRAALRADPDIIMVGEIRDRETALLAIQAALTGHLVFSTLHTNSAAGILPRLLDMGVEPFLIASTVRLVVGQRLIRKLADDENSYDSSPEQTRSIQEVLQGVLPASTDSRADIERAALRAGYNHLPFIDDASYKLYKGRGSGQEDVSEEYKGRLGIYEVFRVSEKIHGLIVQRATSQAIQAAAQEEGMITLRQDGYLKVLAGQTTLVEVDRVIGDGAI